MSSHATSLSELNQLLSQIRNEGIQLDSKHFFGLTFIRIKQNLTVIVLTAKEKGGNENLREIFLDCLNKKYQDLLIIQNEDENESFENLKRSLNGGVNCPPIIFH